MATWENDDHSTAQKYNACILTPMGPLPNCSQFAPTPAVQMATQHAMAVSPPLERIYFHYLCNSSRDSAEASFSLPKGLKDKEELQKRVMSMIISVSFFHCPAFF